MQNYIPYFFKFFSKNLCFLTLLVIFSCNDSAPVSLKEVKPVKMQLESGEEIIVQLALTPEQQVQGLSGKQPNEFAEDEGMLFFNLDDRLRQFWMPDTYFDLDIFCLDKDLKVVDVDRKVPHYIGRENYDQIPRAKAFICRHVFEMKASSAISAKLQVGKKLIWKGPYSPEQIELSIRQGR